MDIIFGNETEAEAFAKNNGLEGATIDEIVLAMAALPSKKDTDRMVIITQVCFEKPAFFRIFSIFGSSTFFG